MGKPQLLMTVADPIARAAGARASSTAALVMVDECIFDVVCRVDVKSVVDWWFGSVQGML